MTSLAATAQPERASGRGRLCALRGPAICGAATGALQAASPLGCWWLAPRTVYALGLTPHRGGLHRVQRGRWTLAGHRRREQRGRILCGRRCDQCQRIGMAARARTGRPRPEGSVATPHSIRAEHALVATVLRDGRLGGRRNPHHRNLDRSSLPWLGGWRRRGHRMRSQPIPSSPR